MLTAEESNFDLARKMYTPKIITWGKKSYHSIPGYDLDDFESDMLEVLWKCVQKYDPNNGARFSTFFWNSAKNRLMDLHRFYGAKKRTVELVYLDGEWFHNYWHEPNQSPKLSEEIWYEEIPELQDCSPEEWVVAYETAREFNERKVA